MHVPLLAHTAWSLVHGLAMLVSAGKPQRTGVPEAEPEALTRRMAEHLFEGIAARR